MKSWTRFLAPALMALGLTVLPALASAQSHSQFFDYTGYNAYWNGTAWSSYATGYGNVLGPDTTTGDFTVYTTGNAASAGLARTTTPVASISAAGAVSASTYYGDGSHLTSVTASVPTGTSGSIVYRDQNGSLKAWNSFLFATNTGSVGVGSTPLGSLQNNSLYATGDVWANATVYAAAFAFKGNSSRILGSASGNDYIAFQTSSTEAMRIVSSGFVGIGTSAPSSTLEISGTGAYQLGVRNGVTGKVLKVYMISNGDSFIGDDAAGGGNLYLARYAADKFFRVNAALGSFSVSTTAPSYVGGAGGLGVGPVGPTLSATLHVSGTVRLADGGESCDSNRTGAIKYSGGDFSVCRNGSSWETLTSIANAANSDRITSGTTYVVAEQATGLVSITQSGINTAYFHPSLGLVTVGVSSTGAVSATKLYGASGTSGAVLFHLRNNADSTDFSVDSQAGSTVRLSGGSADALAFAANSTEAMRIISSGYVGIGTINPTQRLEVFGNIYVNNSAVNARSYVVGPGWSELIRGGSTLNDIEFVTSSTEAMRIVSSGYVGIGTTAPNSKLEVNGTISATNIKIAGTATVGKYSSEPVACAAGYVGMVAMSNTLKDLCLCDGTSWVRVGSGGTACTW